jgi:hypothetical protein
MPRAAFLAPRLAAADLPGRLLLLLRPARS